MLYRRNSSKVMLAVGAILLVAVADSPASQGQGLLRRLRERVQSRVPTAPTMTPAASPATNPASSARLDASRGRQPSYVPPLGAQRVSPQPAQPAAPSSSNSDSASASNRSVWNRSAVDSEQFGGSILAPPAGRSAAPAGSTAARPTLGIEVLERRDGLSGVTVVKIKPESLAAEAGLQTGDVIVAVNGQATPTAADIARLLQTAKSGDSIRARVVRGQTTTAIMIPLVGGSVAAAKPKLEPAADQVAVQRAGAAGQLPLPGKTVEPSAVDLPVPPPVANLPLLGIAVEEARGVRGVTVSAVDENSSAAAAGLRVGDRIVSLQGKLLPDVASLEKQLVTRKLGDELALQLVRDGSLVAADVKLVEPGSLASAGASAPADRASPAKDSVLGGLGSMLGGLLGGKPKADPNAAAAAEPPASAGQPAVQQAGFEEDVPAPLATDPPSLEKLEPRPGGDSPAPSSPSPDAESSSDAIAELRAEIRRLQQRLQELEQNQ
jgi:S1-C subfamily serine protease